MVSAVLDDAPDSPLLERDAELHDIDRLIHRITKGGGGGLLIRGPGGIGKSALLDAARTKAEAARLRVLHARGGLFEREYPFGVVRQLFTTILDDLTLRPDVFAGAAATASAVFDADATMSTTPDAIFAVTYGLFWALLNVAAQGPLLLCVDDMQWADEPSMRLIDFVMRRIDDAPIGVVLGVRSGEDMGAAQSNALGELVVSRALEVVEPSPLGETAAQQLATQMFDYPAEPGFASACRARTSGNPLFLTELIRTLADDGVVPTDASVDIVERAAPPGVNRVMQARIARLGDDAVALAQAIAILGDQGRLRDAAVLSGLDQHQALAAAARLSAAGLTQPGEFVRFAHPVMRDAVEADISPEVVAERHAAAADVLAAHGRDAELIAAHSVLAPPMANPVTVDRLQTAARIAMARSAPTEAVRYLHRALAEPPTAEALRSVLIEVGMAEALSRDPGAVSHLAHAAELTPPGAEQAFLAVVLARLLVGEGRMAEVATTVTRALDNLDPAEDELTLMLESVALTVGHLSRDDAVLDTAEYAAWTRLSGSTTGEASVLCGLVVRLARAGRPASEALALFDRVVESGGYDVLAAVDPMAALFTTMLVQWLGRLGQAVDLNDALMDRGRAANSALVFGEALGARASARWRMGLLEEAEADARQAVEAEGFIAGGSSATAVATLVNVLVDQGAVEEACEVAARLAPPEMLAQPLFAQFVLTAVGGAELARGRYATALERFEEAGRAVVTLGSINPSVNEWRTQAALALVALGRHEEAAEVTAPALEIARRSGVPIDLISGLRAAAFAERPTRLDLLEEARVVAAASELRLEHARVLVDLGSALRRAGSRVEARTALAEGMELAHLCGAHAIAERARTELHVTGARPRRFERSGLNALTPGERRVAELAAEARTNREIAQHLFVSTRTVEAHLRSVYAKLDIATRQDLRGALSI
jgi:DNA-binding CsgD family transcriptional regulator